MTRLLVTTSVSFLALDTATSKLTTIHSGKGLYYGIAISGDRIFLACRNRMVSSEFPKHLEHGEITVFDHELRTLGTLFAPFPLRDMHEIRWYDGKLWITCSYDNYIALWDEAKWEYWYPLPDDEAGDKDLHHYNSFLFKADGFWLLAHNNGESELLFFRYSDRGLIRKIAMGIIAHNIWEDGSQTFTCSSGDGCILGTGGFRIDTGGFPRGYAQDGQGMRYVGINEYAVRAQRDSTNSKIVVYDQAWREVSYFDLHGEGMILDITVQPVA